MSTVQFVSNVFRLLILIAIGLVLFLASLALEGGMLVVHASTIDAGLAILGTDATRLGDNPFVGVLVDMLGQQDTTLAAATAITLAVPMALCIGFALHLVKKLVAEIGGLLRERLRDPQVRLLDAAWEQVLIDLIILGAMGGALALMVGFDYRLFGLRVAADMADSTQNGLLADLGAPVRQLAAVTSGFGGEAYVASFAATAIIPLALWHFLGTSCLRLVGVIEAGIATLDAQADTADAEPVHYGYDHDGNPVLDAHTPIAYHPDGTPVEAAAPSACPMPLDEQPSAAPVAAAELVRYPVMGEKDGTCLTLAEADADPRYVVLRDPPSIWVKSFYEALHDESPASDDPVKAAA